MESQLYGLVAPDKDAVDFFAAAKRHIVAISGPMYVASDVPPWDVDLPLTAEPAAVP
jgi:hypothetical protein